MEFLDTLLDRAFELTLDGERYSALRLGDFLRLERYKKDLFDSVKMLDKVKFINTVEMIIGLQLNRKFYSKIYKPTDILLSLFDILSNNRISANIVFLNNPPENIISTDVDKELWYHSDRFYAQLIHLLGEYYGWENDKILELDVNYAMFLIQEILVEAQMKKEWEYALSELAYKYNDVTKKSEFVPLERPFWMDNKLKAELPKERIPVSLLPFGVINISGFETMSADEKPISEETGKENNKT